MRLPSFGAAVVGALVLSVPAPAVAQGSFCVAAVGCQFDRWSVADLEQLDCGQLWRARNMFYKANGYCFSTPRAIRAFGNEGCMFDNLTGVPLTPVERANVALVQRVERAFACPR